MAYQNSSGENGYVYISSNIKPSVLYIGVTSKLEEGILNYKHENGSRFTAEFNLKVLLYFEEYPNINKAIQREKQLKNWHRLWKFNLIRRSNPELKDLWADDVI